MQAILEGCEDGFIRCCRSYGACIAKPCFEVPEQLSLSLMKLVQRVSAVGSLPCSLEEVAKHALELPPRVDGTGFLTSKPGPDIVVQDHGKIVRHDSIIITCAIDSYGIFIDPTCRIGHTIIWCNRGWLEPLGPVDILQIPSKRLDGDWHPRAAMPWIPVRV